MNTHTHRVWSWSQWRGQDHLMACRGFVGQSDQHQYVRGACLNAVCWLTVICWFHTAMLWFLSGGSGGCHSCPSRCDHVGHFHTSAWWQLADVGCHGVEQGICLRRFHEEELPRGITDQTLTNVRTPVPPNPTSQANIHNHCFCQQSKLVPIPLTSAVLWPH